MAGKRQFELFQHRVLPSFEGEIDCLEMDNICRRTVGTLRNALQRGSPSDSALLAAEFLEQQVVTHEAIRALNRSHYSGDGLIADAFSLLREQVERVFSIALIVRDAGEAAAQYLKDGWYKLAFEWAVKELELGHFEEFKQGHAMNQNVLERLRERLDLPMDALQEVVKRAQNGQIDRRWLSFPPPATIRNSLAPSQVGRVLGRLYLDYNFHSNFTHSSFLKQVMRRQHQQRNSLLALPETHSVRRTLDAGLAKNDLYVALASVCALPACNNDIEAVVAVDKLWSQVRAMSLDGRGYWELGVRGLLPESVQVPDVQSPEPEA